MFCHSCGTQVNSDVQFCPNCGQSLSAPSGPPSVVPAYVVPAGIKARPGEWIGAGWEIVKNDLGNYVLIALVFTLLNSLVPLILQGPLIAGFHIYIVKRLMGRSAEFADLFKGFNFFIPTLVASLIIGLFVFGGTLLCVIPVLVVASMY